MLNKKAQALIEFVLLLPIIIIIIFSSIDLFNMMVKKNDLINTLDDDLAISKKHNETVQDLITRLEKDGLKVEASNDEKYITIEVSKKMKWISPTTELILKNYKIKAKRVIPIG